MPAMSPNTASEKTFVTADLGIGCFSLVERYGCAGGTPRNVYNFGGLTAVKCSRASPIITGKSGVLATKKILKECDPVHMSPELGTIF